MATFRVKVREGELQGKQVTSVIGKKYISFEGIPFAEPPLGELRFKPPVLKRPWKGVLDATRPSQKCAQLDILTSIKFFGSEDCLYLNVFTPSLPQDANKDQLLPVMFFIHGGGFVIGSGVVDHFGPDYIVAKNIVYVTTNYRLGPLGFLCLNTTEAPGNVGLRDQNLAMKWVQQNIRAFNGNPDNITLFGISAGSASVEYHLLSPMSEGLFHKAILQSGSALNPWARTRNPLKLAKILSKQLGIDADDPVEMVKCLREIDVKSIIKNANIVLDAEDLRNGEFFAFSPIVEKTLPGVEPFLNVEPLALLNAGKFYRVPTITGFCGNEGGFFKMKYKTVLDNLKERKFIDFLPSNFNVDNNYYDLKLRQIYNHEDDIEAVDAFLSDVCFLGGINESLKCRLRNNHMNNFIYMFKYVGKLNFLKKVFKIEGKGAYHGDEFSYLFPSVFVKDVVPTASDKTTVERLVQMWTDFASHGSPIVCRNGLFTTEWTPATSRHKIVLEIDKELKMIKHPFQHRLNLWEDLYNFHTAATIIPRSHV